MRFVIISLLSICSFSTATAGISIVGVGANRCASYLESRQKIDKGSFDGQFANVVVEWVRGFATGYNVGMMDVGKQRTTALPSSTVIAYLDKFCRDEPLRPILTGANCLLAELNNEKKKCDP